MKKILLTLILAAVGASAVAHHSAAMFDHTKTVTVHGTVKAFQFTNPHSWLMVMVPGPDGKAVEWGFEAEGPSSLLHVGILPKSFQPGDKVTVTGNPMRDGRPAGALISAVMADGRVISTRPGGPRPAQKPASQ